VNYVYRAAYTRNIEAGVEK